MHDVSLFVEQVSWLANGYLRDSSRFGVMTWIGQRLSEQVRARWLRSFPLEHEAQQRAENELVKVLGLALRARSTEPRLVSVPGRNVDWTATYLRTDASYCRPPMPYISRHSRWVPDLALRGALVALGRGWQHALEWAAGSEGHSALSTRFRQRADTLRAAIEPHSRLPLPSTSLDWRLLERLRRTGGPGLALAEALTAALRFWRQTFGSAEGDGAALRAMGAGLREADLANTDTLLELTTALSIARAATQVVTVLPAHWASQPWILQHSVALGRDKYPALVLASGALRCELGKGTPRRSPPEHHRPVADLVSPWLDEVLHGGEQRSTGHQPDVVLRFWHVDRPERVLIALGDSKRNALGDGEGYLRASVGVATVYLMAFGHVLGLTMSAGKQPQVRTSLVPGVTLFCHQATKRSAESAVSLLAGRVDEVPTVMAFDVQNHFGLGTAGTPEQPPEWSSPSLSAWFACLARQADSLLSRDAT